MEFKGVSLIKKWLGEGSINIFGRPFSGKDTQGKILAKIFDAPLIGGGDILRSQRMSERVLKVINAGELAPTKDFISIVLPHLNKREFAGKPLILSSLGRWHGEEPAVLQATISAKHPMLVAIYLKLDEDEVAERWQKAHIQKDRGIRDDDAGDSLRVRLKEFRNKTEPVIEFYRSKGMLIEVSGNDIVDKVTKNIIEKLASYAKNAMGS